MEIIGKTVRQVLRGLQTSELGGELFEVFPHKPDTNKPFNEELFEVISHSPANGTYVVDLLDEKHRRTGNIREISANSIEVTDVVGLDLLSEA